MNFKKLSPEELNEFTELLFEPLSCAEDVKDWARMFLDLELPLEITDPDSTGTPLDAVWQIYNTFKTNTGHKNPGYILMSCREGMKTASVAILELLLLLHFQLEIAHAAATETQSSVAIRYISDFIFKIETLIKHAGWEDLTNNKRTRQFKTPENKTPFIKILICNPKGMNSLHANAIFLDELDLADKEALKEAKNIVGYSRGIYGVAVYLSTRKYSFGNMQEAIDNIEKTKYKLINWNILDVTEACPPSRHLPDQPKVDMYVDKKLPLKQIDVPTFEGLAEVEQIKYDKLEKVHAGCVGCELLPVCKTRLADKPQTATGGFYKPIVSVIQKFRDNDADVAEAQLMCWKPGSEGLVYPRFDKTPGKGNVLTLDEAFEVLMGYPPKAKMTEAALLGVIKSLGCEIHCGVDWGFTHDAVIVTTVKIPNGEIWVIDCWASPGMEFSDILDVAMKIRDKYTPMKWWCDTAYPANIKSFNRNGMTSPKFTKDVPGGIEALRAKITNAMGHRAFKIVKTENTNKVLTAITKHRFLLDGQGNPSPKPDDEAGVADICDALRYVAQNVFPVRGTRKPVITAANRSGYNPEIPKEQQFAQEDHDVMRKELEKVLGKSISTGGNGGRGGFRFRF